MLGDGLGSSAVLLHLEQGGDLVVDQPLGVALKHLGLRGEGGTAALRVSERTGLLRELRVLGGERL